VEMKSLRPLLRPPWSALLDMTAALQEVFSRRGTRLPPHLPPPPGFSVPEFHARRLWDVRGGALSSYDELRRVVDPVLVETVQDRQ